MTTRAPRPGEVDGVHYHFVDDAEFDRMVEAGEFLEYAVVHGRGQVRHPARPGRARPRDGRLALLEIDLQGARQVRETMPEALFVFLAPPTLGRAGAPAGRSRHRGRGGARAPPGDRAGRAGGRGGVRRDHRQRRRSASERRTRIIDAIASARRLTLPTGSRARRIEPTSDEENHRCPEPWPTPSASPTRRSTTCSRPPTPSTPWSSTRPSAPARSTRTTASSRRACSSTSARSSRPRSTRSRCRSRCARSTRAC